MDNSYVFLCIAGLLFVVFLLVSFKSAKTRRLRITTAGTDETGKLMVREFTRKWNDGFNDVKGMKLYHKADGKRIWIADHWTLEIEEM